MIPEDWFLKGLLLTPEACEEFKNRDWAHESLEKEKTQYELCQWWARRFFDESNGMYKYKDFLRKILTNDGNNNEDFLRKQNIFLSKVSDVKGNNHKNWFFSHCWMIACNNDEEGNIRGRTSYLPRQVREWLDDGNEDLDPEHYPDAKGYFRELLNNPKLSGYWSTELVDDIQNFNPIKSALERYDNANDSVFLILTDTG